MKKILLLLLAILLIGVGAYIFMQKSDTSVDSPNDTQEEVITEDPGEEAGSETADSDGQTTIGQSKEGRDINAYHFGAGEEEILFVGGIHGGYSWNTALVAHQLIDYLSADESRVPEGVRVTVVPVLNPDGLHEVVEVDANGRFSASAINATQETLVSARFNANNVDLNRNFDCEWQSNSVWQKTTVSGGSAPFSEPEAMALRDYVAVHTPSAAIVWYSAAGGVYASSCQNGVSVETRTLMNTYANASGYSANDSFDFYAITGDMVNWLAKEGVPAVSILLTNHTDTEWSKNKAGIEAVLKTYAQ